MHKILEKEYLTPSLVKLGVYAPDVANKAQPGQFVMVRVVDEGERIPLTIAGYNKAVGSIMLLVQAVGFSTKLMAKLEVGDSLISVTGPLGNPTHFGDAKNVLCIGGGVGTAVLFPQVSYLSQSGVNVDVIIGARNKDLIILEKELSLMANNLYIATDDGSKGTKGVVTDVFAKLVGEGKHYDLCIAIGPPIMMKFVCLATKPLGLKTLVSLNPIMIDGTGMCGGCRVNVGGKVKYACVDGPEFDGHEVDFDSLMRRLRAYRDEEASLNEKYECKGVCADGK